MSDSDERTERWLARSWLPRLLTATPYARRLMLSWAPGWDDETQGALRAAYNLKDAA
jgi:hypothetical protein